MKTNDTFKNNIIDKWMDFIQQTGEQYPVIPPEDMLEAAIQFDMIYNQCQTEIKAVILLARQKMNKNWLADINPAVVEVYRRNCPDIIDSITNKPLLSE
jgi:hypothetical protein